jgi:glycyl-tRNA synthetase beta chain
MILGSGLRIKILNTVMSAAAPHLISTLNKTVAAVRVGVHEQKLFDEIKKEKDSGALQGDLLKAMNERLRVDPDADNFLVAEVSRVAAQISGNRIGSEVLEFLADRLKVQQREAGVRHDLIDAVFALGGEDDLVRLLARVKALQAFITTDDGANLLAGYKRAANILKKERFETAADPGKTELTYTPEAEEAALLAALETAESAAGAAVADERFEEAMAALAILRAPIDAFFEKVTVNDADPDKRAARLAMLARVRAACNRVADFSKIEG